MANAASIANTEIAPSETTKGDFQTMISTYEMTLIDAALASSEGHQGKAAKALGLSYHQFRGLLKKHGYAKGAGKPVEDEKPPRPPMRSM